MFYDSGYPGQLIREDLYPLSSCNRSYSPTYRQGFRRLPLPSCGTPCIHPSCCIPGRAAEPIPHSKKPATSICAHVRPSYNSGASAGRVRNHTDAWGTFQRGMHTSDSSFPDSSVLGAEALLPYKASRAARQPSS